jgi:uncharacterized iron-regulated membrane protein
LLRKTIFWLHLATAVLVGAIVLIMATTGVLLTYQKQMQSWADLRGLDGAPPGDNAAPLPAEALVQKARAANRAQPTSIRWRSDEHAPVEVVFGREGSVFVNAYTGEVLGTGAAGTRAFFRKVTDWHRWLAQEGQARERGKMITGAANLGFLFIVLSGFFLWWPRNWTWSAFRNVLMFRRGLRSKARDFNWHNVIGIWAFVPLLVIVSSGAVIGYPWASDLVYRIAGEAPPPRQPEGQANRARALGDVETVIARARQQDPHWRLLTMQLAPAKDGGVAFTVDRSNGGQPQKRAQLVLSRSGDVLKWEPFSAGTPGRRARSILRFAHTGEVAGFAGQTIAGLVSLGAVVMVYTGIALALRRLFNWRRRAKEPVRSSSLPLEARPTRRQKGGKTAIGA